MTRALELLLVVGPLLCGCPRAGAEISETPEPVVAPADAPAPVDDAQCRTPQRFADYDWVPDDARLSTSILRHDPELPAALERLAGRVNDPQLQLPVYASLDLGNLGLQLTNLDRLLATLELDPAELVELHGPRGQFVWSWAINCPPALLSARVLDRFGVMLRADLERPGLRHGAGSPDAFPFDVLTFGEHRMALTLVGQGLTVGAWLHDTAHGGDDGPGRRLRDLADAPIRTVLDGEALLNPSSDGPATRRRLIRVTAQDWLEE